MNIIDNKLTRLLQTSLGGNSKTTIICTIIEILVIIQIMNTFHFGMKVKNINTIVKANEVIIDKRKTPMEYQTLRNKIKMLKKLINDKKSLKKKIMKETKEIKHLLNWDFGLSQIPNKFISFSKLNFI